MVRLIQSLHNRIRELESVNNPGAVGSATADLETSHFGPAFDVQQQIPSDQGDLGSLLPSGTNGRAFLHNTSLPEAFGREASHQGVGSRRSQLQYASSSEKQTQSLPVLSTSPTAFVVPDATSSMAHRNDSTHSFVEEADPTDEDDHDQDDEGVDAMGAVSGSVDNDSPPSALPKRHQYYGPSSTSNLMQQIQEIIKSPGGHSSGRSVGRPSPRRDCEFRSNLDEHAQELCMLIT